MREKLYDRSRDLKKTNFTITHFTFTDNYHPNSTFSLGKNIIFDSMQAPATNPINYLNSFCLLGGTFVVIKTFNDLLDMTRERCSIWTEITYQYIFYNVESCIIMFPFCYSTKFLSLFYNQIKHNLSLLKKYYILNAAFILVSFYRFLLNIT